MCHSWYKMTIQVSPHCIGGTSSFSMRSEQHCKGACVSPPHNCCQNVHNQSHYVMLQTVKYSNCNVTSTRLHQSSCTKKKLVYITEYKILHFLEKKLIHWKIELGVNIWTHQERKFMNQNSQRNYHCQIQLKLEHYCSLKHFSLAFKVSSNVFVRMICIYKMLQIIYLDLSHVHGHGQCQWNIYIGIHCPSMIWTQQS